MRAIVLEEALKIASQPGSDLKPLLAGSTLASRPDFSERQFADAPYAKQPMRLSFRGNKYRQVEIAARNTLGPAKTLEGNPREEVDLRACSESSKGQRLRIIDTRDAC